MLSGLYVLPFLVKIHSKKGRIYGLHAVHAVHDRPGKYHGKLNPGATDPKIYKRTRPMLQAQSCNSAKSGREGAKKARFAYKKANPSFMTSSLAVPNVGTDV